MATEMFKSMTHNSSLFIENLFTVSDISYDLRGGKTITQPPVETTTFGLNHSGMKEPNCGIIFHHKWDMHPAWTILKF